MAVPLCKSHPSQTLQYYVNDSESVALIATESQINKVMPFAKDCENVEIVAYEELMAAEKEDGIFSNVCLSCTLLT